EVLRLVIKSNVRCIDLAGHAKFVNFPTLFDICNGSHSGRPMMLDAGEPRFRREKNIEAVAGHGKTEPVGFLRTGFDRLGGDVLVEFDDLNAGRFLLLDNSPRLVGSFEQITALRAQRPRRRRSDQPRSRRPDARAADLAEIGSVSLGHSPLIVVLRDVRTGGYAEMQVELADKVEQMAVTVDEARKNRLAFDVDSAASRWNCDFATFADRLDSIAFDHDDRILHWRATGSVDERSTRMTSAVGFCASLRAGDIQTISKMRSAGFSHFRPTRVPMSNSPKLVFGCFG